MTTETKTEIEKAFILTVDWCNEGKRGIFCSNTGQAFLKETQHTEDNFWEILDCFSVILNPQSTEMTKEEIKQYKQWIPLTEFSNQYGIALQKEEV
jgi:hypothetical protein